ADSHRAACGRPWPPVLLKALLGVGANSMSGFLGEGLGMVDNPDGRQPTLNDARARVARAEDHITKLESECASVLSPNTVVVVGAHNSALRGIPPSVPQAPPILSILVGETIYNLRSALDYLAYELVYLDGGKPKSDTNFPIIDTEKQWRNFLSGKKGNKKR